MKNLTDDVVLPLKVDDLIKLLNKVYPEKSPNLQAGQRDVVNFINTLKERSEQ